MFPLCPCPLGLDFKLKGWIHSSFPQNGSLFEADFILLDGIPANVIRGEKQYLAAPLVMLKMDPSGKLLPMVIMVEWEGGILFFLTKECLELWESHKLGSD